MHVGETRQDRCAAEIDHVGTVRYGAVRLDGNDALTRDGDNGVLDALSLIRVDQPSGHNVGGFVIGQRGSRYAECEQDDGEQKRDSAHYR